MKSQSTARVRGVFRVMGFGGCASGERLLSSRVVVAADEAAAMEIAKNDAVSATLSLAGIEDPAHGEEVGCGSFRVLAVWLGTFAEPDEETTTEDDDARCLTVQREVER